MTHASIVVFGEALVDLFKDTLVVGGAPFNVARHLAGLNQAPLFISAIGADNAGDLILQELTLFKLPTEGVQIFPSKKTGVVHVYESSGGHTFEIMPDAAYDNIALDPTQVAVLALQPSTQLKMLYHGTLGLRGDISYKTFQRLCQYLKQDSQANIFLDVNWRAGHVQQAIAMQSIRDANFIKMSIEELQMVLVWFDILISCENKLPLVDNVVRPIQHLMKKLNAHLLLITYGDLGSAAFDKQGVCVGSAAANKHDTIVDSVGAGDAFSSVMLLAIDKGWPIKLALNRANQFASDICGIRGATPTDLSFYQQYIKAWQD